MEFAAMKAAAKRAAAEAATKRPCWFDKSGSCRSGMDCEYEHDPSVRVVNVCKYGKKCNNISCVKEHPKGTCPIHPECDGRHFDQYGQFIPLCDYGKNCRNRKCWRLHPNSLEQRERNTQESRSWFFDDRYKQAMWALKNANLRQTDIDRKFKNLGYSCEDIRDLMEAFRKKNHNALRRQRNVKRQVYVENEAE